MLPDQNVTRNFRKRLLSQIAYCFKNVGCNLNEITRNILSYLPTKLEIIVKF